MHEGIYRYIYALVDFPRKTTIVPDVTLLGFVCFLTFTPVAVSASPAPLKGFQRSRFDSLRLGLGLRVVWLRLWAIELRLGLRVRVRG